MGPTNKNLLNVCGFVPGKDKLARSFVLNVHITSINFTYFSREWCTVINTQPTRKYL